MFLFKVYAYCGTTGRSVGYISSEYTSEEIYIWKGTRGPGTLHVNASVEVTAIISMADRIIIR